MVDYIKVQKRCGGPTSARLFSPRRLKMQRARLRLTLLSPHFLRVSAPSTSLSPSVWLVYRCPNCPERCGMERRGHSGEERMIAILLLLSLMYQLNHSSILPRSSPGLSGRHGRKIGKVSPGRRRRRVEMDGTGGRALRKV